MKKIYLDLDGVLCDFELGLREQGIVREGKTKEEVDQLIQEMLLRTPEFYTNLKPIEGAIEGVKYLLDKGYEVEVLTSIPKRIEEIKKQVEERKVKWVKDYLGDITVNLCYREDKKNFAGEDKFLIDDTIGNVNDFTSRGGNGIHFQSWNQIKKIFI